VTGVSFGASLGSFGSGLVPGPDLVAWAENDQKTAETRKFLDSPDVKVAAEIATAVKGEGN